MKKTAIICTAIFLALAGCHRTYAQATPENAPPLTKAAQNEVINTLLGNLNDMYVFPDVAKKAEAKIRERQKKGQYSKITDRREFAQALPQTLWKL